MYKLAPLNGSKAFQHRIGTSVEGREIVALSNRDREVPGAGATLLIGGTHGDEIATVRLLEDFADRFFENGALAGAVVVLPVANPDAYAANSRYNARGVDINRNCGFNWHIESEEPAGPAPWSEPETRALRDFILRVEPAHIVSLHWALAEIDADGPQSTALAHHMWDALSERERRPYRLRVYEPGQGRRRLDKTYQICPGSLGQWCGYGLRYVDGTAPAMITLELPYDPAAELRPSPLPDDHLTSLHGSWKQDADGYLRAVEGTVEKMLLAACNYPAAQAASAAQEKSYRHSETGGLRAPSPPG